MKRSFRYRSFALAILAGSLVCGRPALAQTRLGLHATQEELNIWRQRAQSGPYKSSGDQSTNSPGDWETIVNKKNAFMSNPSRDRWDGTTLLLSNGCVNRNIGYEGPVALPQSDLGTGEALMAAGFYALVTDDASVRAAVRSELIAQARTPGTDFSNRSRWCVNETNDSNPFFQIAIWLSKLLHAYDYVRPQLSSADRQELDGWFFNATSYFDASLTRMRHEFFIDPNNGNYTPTSAAIQDCANTVAPVYYGGPMTTGMSGHYNNRSGDMAYFLTAAGVLLNNATFKNHGRLWFQEWIKYGVFGDGSPDDMNRWQGAGPTQGFRYSGSLIAAAVMAADALARAGDISLYTYSTSEGICNNPGTAGGPKSLQMIIDNYLKYVDGSVTRYGTDNGGQLNLSYRIDTVDEVDDRQASIKDVYLAPANVYFRNTKWRSVYMRTASGAPAYPGSNIEGGGYNVWGGTGGRYPGVLFMFGDMEEKVWPYSGESAPQPPTQAPVVNISAKPQTIGSGMSSTLSWSSTNASSCSASGGWTGTKGTSGSESITPARTTAYTLTCAGTGGSTSQTATVTISDAVSGNNLANSTTLIAHSNNFSSEYPRGPQNLWDGDTTSEEGSAGNSGIGSFWLEFDFGKLYDLAAARLFGDTEGNWVCQSWTLEHKQNQTDPYTAAFTNSDCHGDQWFEQVLTGKRARFVKITVYGDSTVLDTQARELEIYGKASSTPSTPTNLMVLIK